MLGHVVDHAKLRLGTTVTHYGGRVAIGVPVVVAIGFAVAAIYMVLADSVGEIAAATILAAVFFGIAIVTALAVVSRERQQREMLRRSARDTALFTGLASAAPAALAGGRRLARRAGVGLVPLAVGAGLVLAMLTSRRREAAEDWEDRT